MDCHKNKCAPPNCSGKFNIYSSGCFTPLQQQPCSVYVQRPPYPQPPCSSRPPYEHFPQQYPQHPPQHPQYPPQHHQYPPQHPQYPPQYPPQPSQQPSSTQSVDRDKLQHQHQFQQQQQLQQIQQQQQHQQQLQQIQQQQLQQQLQQIQQQLHHQLSQQSTFPVLPPLPPIPPLPKLEVPPLPPLPYLSSNSSNLTTCPPRRCRSPPSSPPSSPCSPPSDTSPPTVPSIQILPYPLGYTPPPGTILHNTTTCLPPGYLECNGADILRVEYATLFSMIGTYYGVGDTYTTFTLPNLQNTNTKPYQYIIRYDLQEVPTIVIKPHLEVIDVKVQGVDTICFS